MFIRRHSARLCSRMMRGWDAHFWLCGSQQVHRFAVMVCQTRVEYGAGFLNRVACVMLYQAYIYTHVF